MDAKYAAAPPSTASRRRAELVERAGEAGDLHELFGAASERLRRLVPFDAAMWLANDPATHLPTAPTRTDNLAGGLTRERCLRVWELEYLVEDVNLYRDLTRADTPAGGLRLATRDCPGRSARYREFLRPNGFDDELRAVARAGGSPWASISLYRGQGRPAFDAREIELVANLSRPLAEAMREHARPTTARPRRADDPGPGVMLFAPDGELIFANDDALAWLDELTPDTEDECSFGTALPMVVAGTLMRARAIAEQRDDRAARARVRSRAGRWLVCHASCLRDANGELGNTALVVEPATASEIAPIVVQAYELSAREQEITRLIAGGFATAQIAGRLHLSAHTVRDYVKAVFEKVGVCSRGELVAKLFADHHDPSTEGRVARRTPCSRPCTRPAQLAR
jgi:DNA-binding CsgD family transcriptional regulator